MKKLAACILAAVMVVSMGTTGVYASHGNRGNCHGQKNTVCDSAGKGCSFVDENNDGVCDNRGENVCGNKNCSFVDKNNDGICDNCGNKACKFVDKNKDGICDNCGNKNCKFVDDDKDGVCDNRGKGAGKGSGSKSGKGCGRKGQGCRR